MYHKRRTERRLTGSASRAASHVSHVEVRIRTRINYTYGISHTDDQTTKQNGGGAGGGSHDHMLETGPCSQILGDCRETNPRGLRFVWRRREEVGDLGLGSLVVSKKFPRTSTHPSLFALLHQLSPSFEIASRLLRDCFEMTSRDDNLEMYVSPWRGARLLSFVLLARR